MADQLATDPLPAVLLAVPALIMVAASFRFPGDYGGLLPLSHVDEATGQTIIDVTRDNWRDFFTLENYTRLVKTADTCSCSSNRSGMRR